MNNQNIIAGFTGDVMIGRGVNNIISQKGYLYPWGDVLPLLQSTDINIINLEAALTMSDHKVEKTFNFKAAPDRIKTLQEAKITVANLANNHILDYDEEGLKETLSMLHNAGIYTVGAGNNETEAAAAAIITVKHSNIGVIGFTDNESGWKATAQNCGTNYVNILNANDRERVLTAVEELSKKTDTTLVSIHWGYNLVEEPPDEFIRFAHAIIDHGADIIHGHSAHIFQGIEIHKGKLIMYDTGDFVDDYAVDVYLRNDHSFLFLAELGKHKIESLKLVPVLISNYQVNKATGRDKEWCIEHMQQLSRNWGTSITDNGEVNLKSNNAAFA